MTAARPLRADAERNRQRILGAARTLFAERGVDVSVEEIAAAAGVGIGTFYRRFPDRETLVEAVFETKMEQVVQVARDALEIEDPWDGVPHVRAHGRAHARPRPGPEGRTLSATVGRSRSPRSAPPSSRSRGNCSSAPRPPAPCARTSRRSTSR